MTRINRSARLYYLVLVATSLLLCTSSALADQILENHDDSLTTYKPSSKSNIQDVRALVDQRGVNVDGSLRLGSTHQMAPAGNLGREAWNRNQVFSGARLDTGTFLINDVDLSLPRRSPMADRPQLQRAPEGQRRLLLCQHRLPGQELVPELPA